MNAPKKRKGRQLERPLRLLASLMNGQIHTRYTAAKLLDVEHAAASEQLKALAKLIPGVERGPNPRTGEFGFNRHALGVAFDSTEIVAICLAASIAPLFEGSPFAAQIRKGIGRLARLAKQKRNRKLDNLERKFFFVSRGGDIGLKGVDAGTEEVVEAILAQRYLTTRYIPFEGPEEIIKLKPLSLAIHEHQLYVLGMGDQEFRALRFARMQDVQVTNEAFEYPDRGAYNPDAVFANVFGIFVRDPSVVQSVAVRLNKRWAVYAAHHHWHRSQEVEPTGDGDIILRFKVKVCPELVHWVTGFGDEAEVLAPPELRSQVHKRLAAGARRYT